MIAESELIINPDGSVFHLHLRPGELADTVLLVGDPGRSEMIAREYFDRTEVAVESREFCSRTGWVGGTRLSVVSTGIGCDNIDIVMTELDALVNVDFATREVRPEPKSLRILRLGTSGGLQPDIQIGDIVASAISGGADGVANFYAGIDRVRNAPIEEAFVAQTRWGARLARPYFVHNSAELLGLFRGSAVEGLTLSAIGFYGPQGRVVRLPLADEKFLDRIEAFRYRPVGGSGQDICVTNFEMESSAIAALSALLGHEALTLCTIIAQRNSGQGKPDYQRQVRQMVELALQKIAK